MTDTHRLQERGSLRFSGVETQVQSAQQSQYAARLAVRGEVWQHLWEIIVNSVRLRQC